MVAVRPASRGLNGPRRDRRRHVGETVIELQKLTEDEFAQIARVVYNQTGIHLAPEKLSMLSNRLRKRLRALNLNSFEEYYRLISSGQDAAAELPHFLSAVTTNETYFFRNEQLWKLFKDELVPYFVTSLGKRRALRIWSAASSTGEEAYTAAIALREGLPEFDRWSITIIGSDISPRVLEHAARGVYKEYAVSRMDAAQVQRWFTRKGDDYHLKDDVRRMVKFVPHNLRDAHPIGGFDLIFLRNVLMYFDTTMKKRVLQVVTDALAPGGYLIVGDVDPIRTIPELSKAMTLEFKRPGAYLKTSVRPARSNPLVPA